MKKLVFFLCTGLFLLSFCACGQADPSPAQQAPLTEAAAVTGTIPEETSAAAPTEMVSMQTEAVIPPARLTYLGHASICIQTAEGKVIYVDPFAGSSTDYSLPADLILITHGHADHNAVHKIKSQSPDCVTLTWQEAIKDGEYQVLDLSYVTVQAVQAGNNRYHSLKDGVGYILQFADGKTVYFSGDTSQTQQMARLKELSLDYAFFCCDGVYNMDMSEAIACAEAVGAAHSIPYHVSPSTSGKLYDEAYAEAFTADGALLLTPGQTIDIA